jgi:hypothetical protein
MKNFDLEYKETEIKEYQRQVNLLRKFLVAEPEVTMHKKFNDYRNEKLYKEADRLTRVNITNNSFNEDPFLLELVKIFSYREDNYRITPVKNFLEKDFKELKFKYSGRTNEICFPEIYNGNETIILNFLARYNALKRIGQDCSDLIPEKDESADSVIEKVILGRWNRNANPVNAEVVGWDNYIINESSKVSEEINLLKERPSTRKQVLAMHYLLKSAGMTGIDKTIQAKFIQFIVGKELGAKNIANTSIYQFVKNPFSISDKQLLKELQEIRIYFENIGLTNIVSEINKEIEKHK